MKVLHLTTWKQRCGVADFTQSIVASLEQQGIENEIAPLDLAALRHMTTGEFLHVMDSAARQAAGCDLVHVQHEFSLFAGSGGWSESILQFGHLLSRLRAAERPVVVTFHTEPSFLSMLPIPGPGGAGGAGGIGAFLQWAVRKVRQRRMASALHKLWRKRVASFFDGRPGSFRGLVHTPRTRLGMINSGLAPDCVSVMPLGYTLRDPSFLQVDRAEAKARLGLSPDSILLTIFGFVTEYKGHLVAVKALQKLPARYHLAVVGGPNLANPCDTTLNQILEMWEGADPRRLVVTGYASRETIDQYHAAADICLAPFLPGNLAGSASAGWALTSGKPTIASNIPAFSEIHHAADCLMLCTPNAVHELAWQIERLAGDPALQQKLAHNALQFAAQHSWDRVTANLAQTYRELVGPGTPRLRVAAAGTQPMKGAA